MCTSRFQPRSKTGALAALLALWLAACAGPNGMQTVVDSWKSASIEQATAQWGPPTGTQAVASGTAYVWTHEISLVQPPGSGPRDARAPTDPPIPSTARCERRLIAGPKGTIIGGDWSGTGCCRGPSPRSCAQLRHPGASQ